jgi:hypothetical protein
VIGAGYATGGCVPPKTVNQKLKNKYVGLQGPAGVVKPKPSLLTHDQLSGRWINIGSGVAKAASQSLAPQSVKAKRNYVNRFVTSQKKRQRLAANWRRIDKRKDERLPTAAVMDISQGIAQALPNPSASEAQNINQAYEPMSHLRGDTRNTGYFLAPDNCLQHPTARGQGRWINDGSLGSHDAGNRTRSELSAEAAERAMKKSGATALNITQAACATAGTYTLNEMSAPARAQNVKLAKPLGAPDIAEMENERELEKYYTHNELGAPMTSGTQPVDADWAGAQGNDPERPISPFRVENGESEADHIKKLLAYQKKRDDAENKKLAHSH